MNAMNASSLELLRNVTRTILDLQRPVYTLRQEVIEMTHLLADSAMFNIDLSKDIGDGETRTPNGMAVSPTVAAMCADDYVRTSQFIRGTHAAVQDIRKRSSNRPARVLYVGCGPYATLAVPLMAIFSPHDVRFTLLDVHAESIDSATAIVKTMGLDEFVTRYETMDAGQYCIDPEETPDLIVMEIMQACLKKEPQVPITRYLLSQAPDAILVPEEVRIDFLLVDQSREFSFNPQEGDVGKSQRDRIAVSSVFVLNRKTVDSWKSIEGDRLPASIAQIPDVLNQRYSPLLFTFIRVYQDHVLSDYDSGLTYPKTLSSDKDLEAGDTLQFHYRMGQQPQLEFEVNARSSLQAAEFER